MPIPTELVGSLPRPMKLQEAYEAYDHGDITFERPPGRAGRGGRGLDQALRARRRADRHRRRAARVELRDLPDHRHAGRHRPGRPPRRRRPVLRDLRRRPPPPAPAPDRRPVPLQDVRVGVRQARTRRSPPHDVKQAVIAPSMLMLLYPLEGELDGYSREQFLDDLCDEVEKDIRQCFDAGAVRVSIDFTEGRLANKNDSRNPWTNKDMLDEFIDLNNRVIDRFSPDERRNIGIHTCPGGDCDSVHSAEVPYEQLLSKMFNLNAGYFLIQCASEADREKVYELCGQVQPRGRQRHPAGLLHRRHQPAVARGRDARGGPRPAADWRPSTSRRSASARPTTAASRRSAATSSPSTARPTSPATSRWRRSRRAWRARGWRPRRSGCSRGPTRAPT